MNTQQRDMGLPVFINERDRIEADLREEIALFNVAHEPRERVRAINAIRELREKLREAKQ